VDYRHLGLIADYMTYKVQPLPIVIMTCMTACSRSTLCSGLLSTSESLGYRLQHIAVPKDQFRDLCQIFDGMFFARRYEGGRLTELIVICNQDACGSGDIDDVNSPSSR